MIGKSLSYARRSLRPIGNAAVDYLKTSHPKVRGPSGHIHAKFTKSGNWQRYYIPLLANFQRAGYSVSAWPSASFLHSPSSEEFGFFRIPWIRLSPASKAGDILLTDDAGIASRASSNRQRVFLLQEDHYRPELAANEIRLPVLMHPKMYLSEDWEQARKRTATDEPRDIRLAFAGNLDPTWYDSNELVTRYSVMTRAAVVRSLRESHGDSCLWIRTWDEKVRLESIRHPIVIVDSFKAGLGPDEYFKLLARSQFFLALPGLIMPNCHNLAESMSVGCVPVLQSPEWRAPLPLAAGSSCVTFDSAASLPAAVEFVLGANPADVASMRERVESIFREFIEPDGFVKRIMERFDGFRGGISVLLLQPDG
jgi:hypothetical protein